MSLKVSVRVITVMITMCVVGSVCAESSYGGGCPFRRRMSPSEKMHSATLSTYNDTRDRELFETKPNRQRRDERGFLSKLRNYMRHCVHPVLVCGNQYRSYSGVCNNVRHSSWGSATSCLLRILPAFYSDGISLPVGDNEGLPSASTVSVHLEQIPKGSNISSNTTHLFFAFGQFLDHDIASSVVASINKAENPESDCCLTRSIPQCSMSLDVSTSPFYRRQNVSCVNFVRSARCPCSSSRERQQMNGATSFIDLSQIYGNSQPEAESLRNKSFPFLLDSFDHGALLPLGGKICVSKNCFRGADARINQHAGLTSMHTIFMRYHNYLAIELRTLNPHWSEHQVFEEARRINIAQYQVIVIKEFLPLLLGDAILEDRGISFSQLSHGSIYDSSLEAGMFNEFLTAAFRLHTLIPETLSKDLGFNFFNTDEFFTRGTDQTTKVLRSLITSTGRSATFPVSDTVAHHVYDTDGDFGLDLVAVNIQRGRDHGLRPYTDYVGHLQNLKIEKYDDLLGMMSIESVNILRSLYKNVDDIDLYVGGYLERPRHGLLSTTMARIVLKQFELSIKSDRFFVTHENVFTGTQLRELMKTSFAEILCTTTNLESVWKLPLEPSSPELLCENVDQLDLKHWLVQ